MPPSRSVAAPPLRSCCWSYDAASSPPAIDATRAGTTGLAASTHKATGPRRANGKHLTDLRPVQSRKFAGSIPESLRISQHIFDGLT